MLLEQKERIIKIVEGIDGLPNDTRIKGMQFPTSTLEALDLPLFLLGLGTMRPVAKDTRNYEVPVVWSWTLFIKPVTQGTLMQADYEPIGLAEIIMEEFLSRPHLDFNDTGLDDISRPIVIALNGDTAHPISYPLGTNSATRYWGVSGTITITSIRQIELAT